MSTATSGPDRTNSGETGTLLGKFDFRPAERHTVTLPVKCCPREPILHKSRGLPDKYAAFRAGFFRLAALSQADAAAAGIVSQEQAGQGRHTREDHETFPVLNRWRHNFQRQDLEHALSRISRTLTSRAANPLVSLDSLPRQLR